MTIHCIQYLQIAEVRPATYTYFRRCVALVQPEVCVDAHLTNGCFPLEIEWKCESLDSHDDVLMVFTEWRNM